MKEFEESTGQATSLMKPADIFGEKSIPRKQAV
jgi:hypothetical protein